MQHIIQQGHVYRSVTPRLATNGYVNDRLVLKVNLPNGDVMYDSPVVSRKRGHYPRCRLDAFQRWAGADVTTHLQGCWQQGLDDEAHTSRLIAADWPLQDLSEHPNVGPESAPVAIHDGMTLSAAGWLSGVDLPSLGEVGNHQD